MLLRNCGFSSTFLLFILSCCLCVPGSLAEITYSAEHDPEVLILFFCFGLLLGGLTTFLLSRFAPNLPYTVVMFLLGAAFAAIVRKFLLQSQLTSLFPLFVTAGR
jgi:membrane protein YqaA with SNARE-associated domain